jgi:type II secretory pathway pseudopilin PulG
MLIEVLVSALVLTIASAAVATVLAAAVSTSGEQRLGSEAYALAQQDQSRLATMQLALLNNFEQTREVPLNGTTFKVRSHGLWVNNKTSSPSCTEGAATADYVQITSVVTWPRMEASEKAKIESILSPSGAQSVDPGHGTLPISVVNEKNESIPHLQLSGTQIEGVGGKFSAETDANGCALITDLPTLNSAGEKRPNYNIIANGELANLVNKESKAKETTQGVASTETPQILSLRFDHPATIPINFDYRVGNTAEFKPAKADSLVVFNTGMSSAKVFWTSSGLRESPVNAYPLFPFTSPYSIYAGSCSANNPNPKSEANPPTAAAIANVIAPSGGIAEPATIQLPALNLTVTYKSTPFKGARVTVTDSTCTESKGSLVKRIYTTNKEGNMSASTEGVAEPGLPWGSYQLCVSGEVELGKSRRVKVEPVTVQNLTSGTPQAIELSGGESAQTCS